MTMIGLMKISLKSTLN